MRIRQYPAAAFAGLVLLSAYLGLAPQTIPSYKQSDKVLHFVTFLLITVAFYWIIETSRRRVLHLTIFVCPVTLGIGSEIAQGLLPNGRDFDPYDIVANVLGSAVALGACTWYHKRMLERKRQARQYNLVPGEEDVELGEGLGDGGEEQESGVTGARSQTLEEEVENWDENNWEEDEPTATEDSGGDATKASDDDDADGSDTKDIKEAKKRSE